MVGTLNKVQQTFTELPTIKGYTFESWGEYNEVVWQVADGTYDSIEEYAEWMYNDRLKNKNTIK